MHRPSTLENPFAPEKLHNPDDVYNIFFVPLEWRKGDETGIPYL